jgi:DNA-binding MarR family transcriptional regulator
MRGYPCLFPERTPPPFHRRKDDPMNREDPTRYRVLDHLYRINGGNEDAFMAPVAASQMGIAGALGFTRARVGITLQRAMEKELVSRSLRHVPDHPRRLKTYRLTEKGYAWLWEASEQ